MMSIDLICAAFLDTDTVLPDHAGKVSSLPSRRTLKPERTKGFAQPNINTSLHDEDKFSFSYMP